MSVEFTVGEVGFGPSFATNPVDSGIIKDLRAEIADLEAKNRELTKRNNRLARALERCAALSPEVSGLKHEVLLEHHNSL